MNEAKIEWKQDSTGAFNIFVDDVRGRRTIDPPGPNGEFGARYRPTEDDLRRYLLAHPIGANDLLPMATLPYAQQTRAWSEYLKRFDDLPRDDAAKRQAAFERLMLIVLSKEDRERYSELSSQANPLPDARERYEILGRAASKLFFEA